MPTTLPLLADVAVCCSRLTSGVLDDSAAERLAGVFKALGDPSRVKLLSLIAAAGEDGACVCDLVEPVRLSQPTVSHHMRQLVDAGLIAREQRGKWAYYRLVDGALAAVAGALVPATPSASCSAGQPRRGSAVRDDSSRTPEAQPAGGARAAAHPEADPGWRTDAGVSHPVPLPCGAGTTTNS